MKSLLIFLLTISSVALSAQDSIILKVHFLYGSKPLAKFRKTEKKWFGGMLGGHVGLELYGNNKIVSFLPRGRFHIFSNKRNRHSGFAAHPADKFYGLLGGYHKHAKRAIIHIPLSAAQVAKLDSITADYLKQTPYDYAFFGMRCGSSSYEILAQLGILPRYSNRKTYMKIFYPKKMRKMLLEMATNKAWTITRQEGSDRRKWEQD